jgi:3',5'-cyclic-AMP phosphodiesterase
VKIIHLSDIHSLVPQLKQLVLHIGARPDLDDCALVVTGDVTDDGQPQEWRAIELALAPLVGKLPIMVIPGNHDCGALGVTYDRERAETAAKYCRKLSSPPVVDSPTGLKVWELEAWRVIGLDSQRGNADDWLPPLARGEIGTAQLAALEIELADPAPTIILLHHHPRWHDQGHLLEDAGELLRLLERRPQVKAILFGHQHVEGLWGSATARLWISSGKSTEVKDGHLRYRTLELETMRVQGVTLPAP